LEAEKETERKRASASAEKLSAEQRDKKAALQEADKHRAEKEAAEKRATQTATFASIVIAGLTAVLLEITINSVFPWNWLLNHPNSYGIQGCLSFMVVFGIVGSGVKRWRMFCWGVAFLGLLLVLFQILGGPGPKP